MNPLLYVEPTHSIPTLPPRLQIWDSLVSSLLHVCFCASFASLDYPEPGVFPFLISKFVLKNTTLVATWFVTHTWCICVRNCPARAQMYARRQTLNTVINPVNAESHSKRRCSTSLASDFLPLTHTHTYTSSDVITVSAESGSVEVRLRDFQKPLPAIHHQILSGDWAADTLDIRHCPLSFQSIRPRLPRKDWRLPNYTSLAQSVIMRNC